MINFDAFKKKMIQAKVGMIDVESKVSNDADANAFKKINIEDEYKLYQSYFNESLTDKSLGWKKKVEQKVFKNGYMCSIY